MACPGGCVNGGGQPILPASYRNFNDVRAIRAAALYADDQQLPVRKSHENPDVKRIYEEYRPLNEGKFCNTHGVHFAQIFPYPAFYYELTGNVGLDTMIRRNIQKKVTMSEYLKKITKEELYDSL